MFKLLNRFQKAGKKVNFSTLYIFGYFLQSRNNKPMGKLKRHPAIEGTLHHGIRFPDLMQRQVGFFFLRVHLHWAIAIVKMNIFFYVLPLKLWSFPMVLWFFFSFAIVQCKQTLILCMAIGLSEEGHQRRTYLLWENLNWVKFKDLFCYLWLPVAKLVWGFLTQEIVSSNRWIGQNHLCMN